MAGAGLVILFVVAFVGCGIWSVIYLTCAAHYFLTTIIDSSTGHDEVHYPSEAIIDWWWKPIFCLWVLAVPIAPIAIVYAPFLARQPIAYFICVGLTIWMLYPISLLSALFSQNWMFFLHPGIAWRMLRHFGALAYVHAMTLLSAGVCGFVLFQTFMNSFLWAILAAIVVPTSLLFYARHWGRFAWLALNFLPRSKGKRSEEDRAPVMAVEEVEPPSEGIREGMPPMGHGIQSGAPVQGSTQIQTAATMWPEQDPDEDEWATDKKPYRIIDDGMPSLAEQELTPMPAAAMHAAPIPELEEEEDEWAPVKKPYKCEDPTHPEAADATLPQRPEADRPFVVSKYYDDRARKEKAEAARKQAQSSMLPAPSKKTPTFRKALFFGVWEFMIYERTLGVWFNLVLLTAVELFFLLAVRQFWPRLD